MNEFEQKIQASKAWIDFCENGLQEFDGNSNVRYPFPKMTKRFGKNYIQYLEAAFEARDEMSLEEFCKINGEVPPKFLNRFRS